MVAYRSLFRLGGIITLIATLLLATSIASFTASTFFGLYETLQDVLIGSRSELLLYSARSRLPHTSIIPLNIYYSILDSEGVEAATPEVVALAYLLDRLVVVRGVDPVSFYNLFTLKIINGSLLRPDEPYYALIGYRLAGELGLGVGERILLQSVMREEFMEVKIKGVYRSDTYLDDEVIVSLQVGQWLRGIPADAVSLIRVKIRENAFRAEDLLRRIGSLSEEAGRPHRKTIDESLTSLLTALSRGRYSGEYILRSPKESIQAFLEEEFRLNEATLWILFTIMSTGFIFITYISLQVMIIDSRKEIWIVRAIGLSRRGIFSRYLVLLLLISAPVVAAGAMIGLQLSRMFSELGWMRLGPYSVTPHLPLPAILIMHVLIVIIGYLAVVEGVKSANRP